MLHSVLQVFDELRESRPEALARVLAVAGDVTEERLGLSEDDYCAVTRHVSVVFHAAATVRFNEHLQRAADVNIHGTRRVLALCRDMDGLVVSNEH